MTYRMTGRLHAVVPFLLAIILLAVAPASAAGRKAAAPTRIALPPGHTRVVTGKLSGAQPRHQYTLKGKAGQTLKIKLEDLAPKKNHVVSMYHITFPSGKQFGMKGYTPFNGKLTETGRYRITVEVNMMASNANKGRFQLTLSK